MQYKLSDLIDVPALQRLTDRFYEAAGITTALLDLDGTIVTASGWQALCTKFHRVNDKTRRRCLESDVTIANRLVTGQKYTVYRCKNGLVDAAVPVIVQGAHLANFFAGQFFFEPPDLEFFQAQALRFGFDEEAYVRAAAAIPIITEAKLRPFLNYLSEFAQMLAEMGLSRLKQMQAQEAIARSEALLEAIVEGTTDAVYAKDAEGRYLLFNAAAAQATGKAPPDVMGKDDTFLFPPNEAKRVMEGDRAVMESAKAQTYEEVVTTASGETTTYLSTKGPLFDAEGRLVGLFGIARNITDRKRMEDALRKSEQRFRSLVETTSDLVWETDKDGFYTYVSPKVRDLLGYAPEEVIGKKAFDFMPMNEAQRASALLLEIVEPRRPFAGFRNIHLHKNGAEIVIETSGVPVMDARGNFLGYRGIDRDVTERVRAEEELAATRNYLRTVFNNVYEAIFIHDLNGKVLDVNDKMLQMYGVSREEAVGAYIIPDFSGRDYPKDYLDVWKKTLYGENQFFEWRAKRPKDCSEFDVEVFITKLALPGGDFILGAVRDITEQKRAQEALRKSEELLSKIVENIPDMVFVKEAEGLRFAMVNRASEELLGFRKEEMIGKNDYDLFPSDQAVFFASEDRQVLADNRPLDIPEETVQTRSGHKILHVKKVPILDNDGSPRYLLSVAEDITQKKQAQEALRMSEERFRGIANNLPGVIFQYYERSNGERGMYYVSERAGDLFGVKPEPLADWPERFDACIAPEDRERWTQSITERTRTAAPWDIEARFIKPTGQEMYVKGVGSRPQRTGDEIVSNGIVIDVTARKRAEEALQEAHNKLEQRVEERTAELREAYRRLEAEMAERKEVEEQLRQSQKMEAIGTLAGGIAHDFNNMLAIIIGNAELAYEDVENDAGPKQNIEQILAASKRARDLVKQILAFSRKTKSGKTPVRLSSLVEETMRLLRGSLPSTIRMEFDVHTESDTVLGDASQIQQVLMNLATNAAHAMAEKGGILSIGLFDVELKQDAVMPDCGMSSGPYVKLTVRDTGIGMKGEVLRRIFEPFFTTKEVGQGTGMGLPVAYGIIRNHGGAIVAESEPGKGAAFTILLPHAEARGRDSKEEEEKGDVPRGKERILLVDDEPLVVQTASATLKRLGYRVTTALGGPEALKIFLETPDRFDLVITDQVMPDLTGIDLAAKMLERRKDLPIILFTGYSEMASRETARAAGIKEFVMKPIVRKQLAEAIRRVMDHGV